MKCNRDCFNCQYDDCVIDKVSKAERDMQNYRDASITVTGHIPKGHYGGARNQARKGGRYYSR